MMKTKISIFTVLFLVLHLSCKEAPKPTVTHKVPGTFQKMETTFNGSSERIVQYEIKKLKTKVYSVQISTKPLSEKGKFKKKLYVELDYVPEKRLLYSKAGLGNFSLRFSENHDTIHETDSIFEKPLIRVE